MKTEITQETPRVRAEPDLVPEPLRLTAQPPSRRGTRHTRRDAGLNRRRAAPGPSRPLGRPGAPRRRGDRHAIVASTLAVLALVGCVMAVLMLATQPTATRLEREIGALSRRLASDQSQLATLRAAVGRTDARGGALSRQLSRISGRLGGIARSVHGLQSASTGAQKQAIGLRDCVPQLQQELTGLALQTRSVRGRVTSVGLLNPIGLSAPCQALFSGL